jgi:hypothetical protein|eukprot:evm.model.NODE_3366_length_53577_cov_19.425985.20
MLAVEEGNTGSSPPAKEAPRNALVKALVLPSVPSMIAGIMRCVLPCVGSEGKWEYSIDDGTQEVRMATDIKPSYRAS